MDKILIVDDDQKLLADLQVGLDKMRQFEVLTAADNDAAIGALSKNKVSVLVTALDSSKVDGLELVAYMTQHHQSTPIVIMVAIPFSLIGILPAHWIMGAFFTATSMIGFIAGAGIVVRNSIILVDFIELRLQQGMPLDQAVIDAGAVRFRPMMLTAAAVVVGASVILFDPIFQGLAISLMAGEVASLLFSRMTVPVLYFLDQRRKN